jgi:MFS-type transporter involved in bile tolerance (Atg22 family)
MIEQKGRSNQSVSMSSLCTGVAKTQEVASAGGPSNSELDTQADSTMTSQHRFLDGNAEAIAFLLDSVATSIIYSGSGAFLVTTLIKLAKNAAGCAIETEEGESKLEECNAKIHGMKPQSLLSTYATAIGLLAAILSPICGAIIDTTKYRRAFGRFLAVFFTFGVFATIFLTEENWFAISIVYAVVTFTGWFETMTVYAYLPELTDDENTLNRYTRVFGMVPFTCMMIYLALVVGLSTGVLYQPDKDSLNDEIGTSRLAQSIQFFIAAILFSIAWGRLFKPRPPTRTNIEEPIWKYGFVQLYKTTKKVHREHPVLQWFFIAIALCEAGTSALFIVAITFLTDVLNFGAADNGAIILVLLISSIPGAWLSSKCTHRFGPVFSSMIAIIILILSTSLVAGILKSPSQKTVAYFLAIGWGVGIGFKWTVDRMLYAMILPNKNQNTEFSGVYVFFRIVRMLSM